MLPGRPAIWRRGPVVGASVCMAGWSLAPPGCVAAMAEASAVALGDAAAGAVRPGFGVPPPAMAEAIDSWRVTRLVDDAPTGPDVPLEPVGPEPTMACDASGRTVPPCLAAEACVFSVGNEALCVAEEALPGAAATKPGVPEAATDGAGPDDRARRATGPLAVAEGRPAPVERGWPDRATSWADPTAYSALPAAPALLPAAGLAASRRTATLEATRATRLDGAPPVAAGMAVGCDTAAIAVDGRLTPPLDRASVVGRAGDRDESAGS